MLMLLWTLCSVLVLCGAECLGGATDAACDAVGLIQSRVQQKKPKVYVYELPSRFRNQGHVFGKHNQTRNSLRPEQWTCDLVFQGPPGDAEGYSVWSAANMEFRTPVMLHYRLLNSPQRTFDVDDADVFFIPDYQFAYPITSKCTEKGDLVETLTRLNPKLKDPAWAREKGPRHLLASGPRQLCEYMYEDQLPQLRSAVRISVDLADDENRWNQDLPWRWYNFPFFSVFHVSKSNGPLSAIPVLQRPRGMAQWLWAWSGTTAGRAKALRQHLVKQCHSDSRCNSFDLKGRWLDGIEDTRRLLKQKLHSTFCVEPPGDSLLRKSLLDSIQTGCIPVLFEYQSLDVYQPWVTPEEWAKATLFIPEVQLVDRKNWSFWATASFDVNSSWKKLEKLYPEHSSLLHAVHPMHSDSQRHEKLEALFPKQSSLSSILRGISEEEVRRKQDALAKIAPRLVIGMDDSNEDAVSILLRDIAAGKSK